MTYNAAIYENIKRWRAKHPDAYHALQNSYKLKSGSNKIYWDKFRYYSYERECKRQRKMLL